ncbi:MAG: hypothetical protein ACOC87_03640 [Candidatus Natronoplasma sp.]
MKLTTELQKSQRYETVPEVFTEIKSSPNRPKKRFNLKVNSEKEAKKASKAGVPILWIDDPYTKILRYPMKIPGTIIVPREYRDAVITDLNLHTFESKTPFSGSITPKLEDVVVFMLTLDSLAARAMIDRNELDHDYLQKRIYQENLEEEAVDVHLQDYLSLPYERFDSRFDRERLLKIINRNKVEEVLP